MSDDPVYGSFEEFGDTPAPGLTTGGLDLGGQLKLPDSLTDPLAQPPAEPDYYQPIPAAPEHEPENLLQRGYDMLDDQPAEPGYVDPVEQERIEQEWASEQTLDQTTISTPEIDI